MRKRILASRGSRLSIRQDELVEEKLRELQVETERLIITTRGDSEQKKPLGEIGGNGLFVREIEEALLTGKADFAVHSAKDLPYDLADGLTIGAVIEPADPSDCMIWKKGTRISPDGRGIVIGTGSARRREALQRLFPNAEIRNIRGNVETRLRKLEEGLYDAIILAKAGIDRLGIDLSDFTVRKFTPEEMIPAGGQGILALECRADDEETLAVLRAINDPVTFRRFVVERCLFRMMKADCRMAIGVHVRMQGDAFSLYAMFEGKRTVQCGRFDEYEAVCRRAADEIYTDTGCVYLVGAGCGEGLITVRGLALLRSADVVIYDDLVDAGLLDEAPALAEKIYMGKRYGQNATPQETICETMIRRAREGRRVIRLKGGDSFVFGRGGEEYLALQEAGIPCAVIPGVSSCIAVPENAGIPVTHRKQARSFTVVTGHTEDGSGEDAKTLASLSGTLVYLMGLSAIRRITEDLIRCGKDPETPASVISRGFSPYQKRIDGTLATIADLAADAERPAVLVIGQNAAFHMTPPDKIREPEARALPLSGISVSVTGSVLFAHRTAEKLKAAGAAAHAVPTIRIRERAGAVPEDAADAGWIVTTSSNGVHVMMRQMRELHIDIRELSGVRFACLGRGTAETLARYGIFADFIPSRYTAGALGRELAQKIRGTSGKVLVLRASNGSPDLTDSLSAAGIRYEEHTLYDTLPDDVNPGPVYTSDYLVFGSAGGVRVFFSNRELAGHLPGRLRFVCIGAYTAATLRKYTDRPVITAEDYTADGIVRIIRSDLDRR